MKSIVVNGKTIIAADIERLHQNAEREVGRLVAKLLPFSAGDMIKLIDGATVQVKRIDSIYDIYLEDGIVIDFSEVAE